MSTYLANDFGCYVFGEERQDEITLQERIMLISQDGTVIEPYLSGKSEFIKDGEIYTAKTFWFIYKTYNEIGRYDTKEAEKEYNRILAELSANNTVVRL